MDKTLHWDNTSPPIPLPFPFPLPFPPVFHTFRQPASRAHHSFSPVHAPWNSILPPSFGVAAAALSNFWSSRREALLLPGCRPPSVIDRDQMRRCFTDRTTHGAAECDPSTTTPDVDSSDQRPAAAPTFMTSSPTTSAASDCPVTASAASDYFRQVFALQLTALHHAAATAATCGSMGASRPDTVHFNPFPADKPFDVDVINPVTAATAGDNAVSDDYIGRGGGGMEDFNGGSPVAMSATDGTSMTSFQGVRFNCGSSVDSQHSCPGQRKKLTDRKSLKVTGARHHESVEPYDDTAEMIDIKSTTTASGGYKCPYCAKLYSRKYGLKIHIRTHTGFKPLQCRICQRPFGDPSNLNKHVRLHAAAAATSVVGVRGNGTAAALQAIRESPYRCRYCGKVLVRRRDLERHIRSRHPGVLDSDAVDVSVNEDFGQRRPGASDGVVKRAG